jgi:signal transduction histidine kinase
VNEYAEPRNEGRGAGEEAAPANPGSQGRVAPMEIDAELRAALMATSRSILAAQRRAERELRDARDALDQRNMALASANALLAATLDATPVGVLATGPLGDVTLHNRRFDTLWTLSAAQIEAHGVASLFDVLRARLLRPDDFLAWLALVNAEPDAALPLHCETVDGRHLECVARPQSVGNERVGMVYNWLDVTERVNAEVLRSQAHAARLANEAKTVFMSRASHELRTPLNAVLGFSQLLQLQPVVAESGKASSHVQHILRAGTHLLALMDDLLQISRIESGLVRMSIEDVDAGAAVEDAIRLCEPIAAQRAVRMECLCTGVVRVRADRIRLRQILMNLLSNAIKYNKPGGAVTVRVVLGVQGPVLAVEDAGHGMNAEQLTHLFEPFNRLGAESSRTEGTGLGLVITRQLVQQMGGSIEVSSVPGVGSVFSLGLPEGTTEV